MSFGKSGKGVNETDLIYIYIVIKLEEIIYRECCCIIT